VYVLQYGLGIALMTAFIEGLHLPAEYVPALVIVITLPFTFCLARWIIKREKRTCDEDPSAQTLVDMGVRKIFRRVPSCRPAERQYVDPRCGASMS
jgi:hypothetical protein